MFNQSKFFVYILMVFGLVYLLVNTFIVFAVVVFARDLSQALTPFLRPPFAGRVSEYSIFDHSQPGWIDEPAPMPDHYAIDNAITALNGVRATGDNTCIAETQPCSYFVDPTTLPTEVRFGFDGVLSYEGHDGIDFGMNYDYVLAASNGQVTHARWADSMNHRNGFGLYISIKHETQGQTFTSLYGHLNTTAVRQGDMVAQSQVVGISGNSGGSSGSHLHFGLYQGTSWIAIDPYGWSPLPGFENNNSQDPTTNESLWEVVPAIYEGSILPAGEELSFAPPLPPSTGYIVDDNDAVLEGDCWSLGNSSNSQNGSFRYTTPLLTGAPNCSIRWNFPNNDASIGNYDVWIRIPESALAISEGAQYAIQHNGTVNGAIINQNVFPNPPAWSHNGWVYVGTHCFASIGSEYVFLGNVTLDSAANSLEPISKLHICANR